MSLSVTNLVTSALRLPSQRKLHAGCRCCLLLCFDWQVFLGWTLEQQTPEPCPNVLSGIKIPWEVKHSAIWLCQNHTRRHNGIIDSRWQLITTQQVIYFGCESLCLMQQEQLDAKNC